MMIISSFVGSSAGVGGEAGGASGAEAKAPRAIHLLFEPG